MTRTRLAAAAAVSVTAGAGIMLFTLLTGPGPWWQGYVSEAGASGRPDALLYRSGLILLAFGVALLGRALARAGLLLAVAAVFAGTSSVVPCSSQCPLPPYEATTAADVIHTAASIVGLAVLAAAMAVTWATAARPASRRLAATALGLTVPLGAAEGLSMLIAGRGTTSALLERVLLTVAVSWLVGTALLTAAADNGRQPC